MNTFASTRALSVVVCLWLIGVTHAVLPDSAPLPWDPPGIPTGGTTSVCYWNRWSPGLRVVGHWITTGIDDLFYSHSADEGNWWSMDSWYTRKCMSQLYDRDWWVNVYLADLSTDVHIDRNRDTAHHNLIPRTDPSVRSSMADDNAYVWTHYGIDASFVDTCVQYPAINTAQTGVPPPTTIAEPPEIHDQPVREHIGDDPLSVGAFGLFQLAEYWRWFVNDRQADPHNYIKYFRYQTLKDVIQNGHDPTTQTPDDCSFHNPPYLGYPRASDPPKTVQPSPSVSAAFFGHGLNLAIADGTWGTTVNDLPDGNIDVTSSRIAGAPWLTWTRSSTDNRNTARHLRSATRWREKRYVPRTISNSMNDAVGWQGAMTDEQLQEAIRNRDPSNPYYGDDNNQHQAQLWDLMCDSSGYAPDFILTDLWGYEQTERDPSELRYFAPATKKMFYWDTDQHMDIQPGYAPTCFQAYRGRPIFNDDGSAQDTGGCNRQNDWPQGGQFQCGLNPNEHGGRTNFVSDYGFQSSYCDVDLFGKFGPPQAYVDPLTSSYNPQQNFGGYFTNWYWSPDTNWGFTNSYTRFTTTYNYDTFNSNPWTMNTVKAWCGASPASGDASQYYGPSPCSGSNSRTHHGDGVNASFTKTVPGLSTEYAPMGVCYCADDYGGTQCNQHKIGFNALAASACPDPAEYDVCSGRGKCNTANWGSQYPNVLECDCYGGWFGNAKFTNVYVAQLLNMSSESWSSAANPEYVIYAQNHQCVFWGGDTAPINWYPSVPNPPAHADTHTTPWWNPITNSFHCGDTRGVEQFSNGVPLPPPQDSNLYGGTECLPCGPCWYNGTSHCGYINDDAATRATQVQCICNEGYTGVYCNIQQCPRNSDGVICSGRVRAGGGHVCLNDLLTYISTSIPTVEGTIPTAWHPSTGPSYPGTCDCPAAYGGVNGDCSVLLCPIDPVSGRACGNVSQGTCNKTVCVTISISRSTPGGTFTNYISQPSACAHGQCVCAPGWQPDPTTGGTCTKKQCPATSNGVCNGLTHTNSNGQVVSVCNVLREPEPVCECWRSLAGSKPIDSHPFGYFNGPQGACERSYPSVCNGADGYPCSKNGISAGDSGGDCYPPCFTKPAVDWSFDTTNVAACDAPPICHCNHDIAKGSTCSQSVCNSDISTNSVCNSVANAQNRCVGPSTCQCHIGDGVAFDGPTCSIDKSVCAPLPGMSSRNPPQLCNGHGRCVISPTEAGYECHCSDNYDPLDRCFTNQGCLGICQNEGFCAPSASVCSNCPFARSGDLCELDVCAETGGRIVDNSTCDCSQSGGTQFTINVHGTLTHAPPPDSPTWGANRNIKRGCRKLCPLSIHGTARTNGSECGLPSSMDIFLNGCSVALNASATTAADMTSKCLCDARYTNPDTGYPTHYITASDGSCVPQCVFCKQSDDGTSCDPSQCGSTAPAIIRGVCQYTGDTCSTRRCSDPLATWNGTGCECPDPWLFPDGTNCSVVAHGCKPAPYATISALVTPENAMFLQATCNCSYPFKIDPVTRLCASACGPNGRPDLAHGVCACDWPYHGAVCDTVSCAPPFVALATPDPVTGEICDCRGLPQWSGVLCNTSTCVGGVPHNTSIVHSNNQSIQSGCACYTPWIGLLCIRHLCEHGEPEFSDRNSSCVCDTGWEDVFCNASKCVATTTTDTTTGLTQTTHTIPIVNTADSTYICDCGSIGQYSASAGKCVGIQCVHGTIHASADSLTLQCVCDPKWSGVTCATPICDDPIRQIVNNGSCVCDTPFLYTGGVCGEPITCVVFMTHHPILASGTYINVFPGTNATNKSIPTRWIQSTHVVPIEGVVADRNDSSVCGCSALGYRPRMVGRIFLGCIITCDERWDFIDNTDGTQTLHADACSCRDPDERDCDSTGHIQFDTRGDERHVSETTAGLGQTAWILIGTIPGGVALGGTALWWWRTHPHIAYTPIPTKEPPIP